jgi:hypothetical protein
MSSTCEAFVTLEGEAS